MKKNIFFNDNFNKKIISLVKMCIIFIFLDFLWIFYNKKMYNNLAKLIQGEDIYINFNKLISIAVIYFFLLIGLYYFVIDNKTTYSDSIIYGAVVYGVYSFTNYLLFKKYPLRLAIVDTLWGIMLCYFTKMIYYNI
tara:strand:+ start:2353 stop:2760 length:408 start_codon:yes stop_codon:yes gene_type:complete